MCPSIVYPCLSYWCFQLAILLAGQSKTSENLKGFLCCFGFSRCSLYFLDKLEFCATFSDWKMPKKRAIAQKSILIFPYKSRYIVKFRCSEKATKTWKNLLFRFDTSKRPLRFWTSFDQNFRQGKTKFVCDDSF